MGDTNLPLPSHPNHSWRRATHTGEAREYLSPLCTVILACALVITGVIKRLAWPLLNLFVNRVVVVGNFGMWSCQTPLIKLSASDRTTLETAGKYSVFCVSQVQMYPLHWLRWVRACWGLKDQQEQWDRTPVQIQRWVPPSQHLCCSFAGAIG